MGRAIVTNYKDKWALYSSIVEDSIVEFKTEDELKAYMAREMVYEGKLKAIELLMDFPHRLVVNDSVQVCPMKLQYHNWYTRLLATTTDEEYFRCIDSKLNELMN
ncbi:hypothetical protein BEH_07565 [Priestia filamentosa]|uniref:Uncharacterized protein n=1 Tax=Priestia filamentosa TaxID=1402861 RepID=A0A0H4KUJ2_9BACI|nr:hypothetical protein [Priestia filamentosa]AKO91968.1 hypothetical protein BEH_07565 [Priestia filamentosa]